MKNIHLTPTNEPSRLMYSRDLVHANGIGRLVLWYGPMNFNESDGTFPQHLNITSDEEIKYGDWIFDLDVERIVKADNLKVITSKKSQCWYYKKIILTTDPELVADGVQPIDDEFLEWFVENPDCERVETERLEDGQYVDRFADGSVAKGIYENYKIIIPKEKPKQDDSGISFYESADMSITIEKPKQETLEEREPYWELVDRKAEQNNTIDLDAYANGVMDGVNWQSERSYSEEEVLDILYKHTEDLFSGKKISLEEWFNQFKKK